MATDNNQTTFESLVRQVVREEVRAALDAETVQVRHEVVVVDPRRLYSVSEVARLWEVSRAYVYERINAGEISVVELGDGRPKQRVTVGEVQRFIDSRSFGGLG
jgi:excisionase family DNA binding protein